MKKKRHFYDQTISKRNPYYKFIINFFKQHGIRYEIKWRTRMWGGHADSDKGKVHLRVSEYYDVIKENSSEIRFEPISVQKFLSLAFHESCHILNFRDNKFKEYHTISGRMTKKRLRAWIRTGIRAEKYTDWRASKLMAKHFPDIPYYPGYDAEGVKRFRQYQIAYWRQSLKEMSRKPDKSPRQVKFSQRTSFL